VHEQLWQKFFWKGMRKNGFELSVFAGQFEPRRSTRPETWRAAAHPTDSNRDRPEPHETRSEHGAPSRAAKLSIYLCACVTAEARLRASDLIERQPASNLSEARFQKQRKRFIMFASMKSSGKTGLLGASTPASVFFCLSLCCLSILCLSPIRAFAQPQARRLILKDGSYQSVTKYEIHADRVRYFSAERGEWEEIPKALIDWDATEKFEHGRQEGKVAPEAVELDKELEAERQAERAKSPQVAPGLRLPDEGGIFLLDTFENQAQLAELHQSGGDLDKNAKSNILRAVINPLGSVKQTIDLPTPHAKVQSHTTIPSLYINVESNNDAAPGATAPAATGDPTPVAPTEHFKIVRVEVKNGKRIVGAVKVAPTGKTKTDERFVPATSAPMFGGWIKLTPTEPLTAGEYAVAEMIGKEGINIYVWDFGVNPSAPANAFTWKPDPAELQPKSDQPTELQKRDKQ
jgi:hypothetical protein